jgi:hypothetical protein
MPILKPRALPIFLTKKLYYFSTATKHSLEDCSMPNLKPRALPLFLVNLLQTKNTFETKRAL